MVAASNNEGRIRSGKGHDVPTASPQEPRSRLSSKRPRELETARTKAVREELEGIVIPLVSFERTTAEESIAFLSLRVEESGPDPAGGLSFRVKRPRVPDLPTGGHADISYIGHDFEAENISAWKLLKRIASDNGMRVEITDHGVLLTSREADMNPVEEDQ